MQRNITILSVLLALAILVIGFLLIDKFAPHPYALVMQNCDSNFSFAGSHITWHSSIEDAQANGNSRLNGGYDLASIYQSPGEGLFNPLLMLKTTTPLCYDGLYMEWTPINGPTN
jgi:hypothetical protein